MAGPSQRRRSFRPLDGDRLERRILPVLTPMELAIPLHFGVSNDAEVSHFLSIPTEVDLYSLTMQRGETIDVSVDAQQAGSAWKASCGSSMPTARRWRSTTSRGATHN